MWNALCHGLSILSAAFAIACRSWGFWMSVGGVAGLAAVYVWWRRRMVLWAFFLALLFPLAVVGIVCYELMACMPWNPLPASGGFPARRS